MKRLAWLLLAGLISAGAGLGTWGWRPSESKSPTDARSDKQPCLSAETQSTGTPPSAFRPPSSVLRPQNPTHHSPLTTHTKDDTVSRSTGVKPPFTAPPASGQSLKYAVLVGINNYHHERLPDLLYAVNDARELGAVLAKAGFVVTVLSDETGAKDAKLLPIKANIERSVAEVLKKCQRGDMVVIGLAGHGLQFEKKTGGGKEDAFFCPQDGRPFRDQVGTLVSLGKIYTQMEESFAGMKVLLVDACRDDPDAERGTRGLNADQSPRPPQGVAALFSCRSGERAYENSRLKHGVFFYHIIQGLQGKARDQENEVTFAGLAAFVNLAVPRWVSKHIPGGKQSPNLKADYSTEPVLMSNLPGLLAIPEVRPVPAAPPGDQFKPVRIEDRLAQGDEKDTVRTSSFRKVYPFKMTAGTRYVIDLASKDFDSYLRLEDEQGKQLAYDDDSGGYPHARLYFRAPGTGTYRVIATTYAGSQTGRFTLVARAVNVTARPLPALVPRETVRLEERLEGEENDLLRPYLPGQVSSFYKVYSCRLTAETDYVIDMVSKDFDPHLRLDEGDNLMARSYSSGNPKARINFHAFRTANYRISAGSLNGKTGTFTLSIEPGMARFEGMLNKFSQRDTVRRKSFCWKYFHKLNAGSEYVIDMVSKDLDSYLRLEDTRGKELAHDDDSGGSLNARITFRPLRSEFYWIIATTFGEDKTGHFTVTIQAR